MLVEDRLAFLLQRFQPLAATLISRDMRIQPDQVATLKRVKLPIPPDMNTGINQQPGEDVAQKLVNFIISIDPDPKKRSAQWLLTVTLRQNQPMPMEDLQHAAETLVNFDKAKQSRQIPPQMADINRYKSLSEINAALRGQEQQTLSADEAEQQEMMAEAEVTYDGPDALVLLPKTKKAACYFGRNTEWCTAWGSHTDLGLRQQGRHPGRTGHYEHYAKQGPLYIIETRPDGKFYQYHAASNQFKDVQDIELRPPQVVALLKAHPGILKGIGEENLIKTHLRALGAKYFSPEALLRVAPMELIGSINSIEDYTALPPQMQTNAALLAGLALHRSEIAAQLPQQVLTPEVAEQVREATKNWNAEDMERSRALTAFRFFPASEWSPQALRLGIVSGALSEAELSDIAELTEPEFDIGGIAVHKTTPNVYLLDRQGNYGWLLYDRDKLSFFKTPFQTDALIPILNQLEKSPTFEAEQRLASDNHIFYGKHYGHLDDVGKLDLDFQQGKIVNLGGRRMWVVFDSGELVLWLYGTKTLTHTAAPSLGRDASGASAETNAAVRQFALKHKFKNVEPDGSFGILNTKGGIIANFDSLIKEASKLPDIAYDTARSDDPTTRRVLELLKKNYSHALTPEQQVKLHAVLRGENQPQFRTTATDRIYDIDITTGGLALPNTNGRMVERGVITEPALKKQIMADQVVAIRAAIKQLQALKHARFNIITVVNTLGKQDEAALAKLDEMIRLVRMAADAAMTARRNEPDKYATDLSSRFAAMNAFRKRAY